MIPNDPSSLELAQDQETLRLLISTLGALAGSLLVAIAAVVAPLSVQSHRHKQEIARLESDRLREAIIEFVDHSMQEEHYDKEWDEPKSVIQTRRERSFASLVTLLSGDNQPVSDWLSGFSGDRAFHNHFTKERKYFVHAALRDLIAWQQGAKKGAELVPFKYEPNAGGKTYRRVEIGKWQQLAAPSEERPSEAN